MIPRLALVAVTAIWGTTFVVIHAGIEHVSPLLILAARSAVAAVLLAVALPGAHRRLRATLAGALRLAMMMGVGMGLQSVGLTWTTPSRSAFLTAVSVVLVPILAVIRFGRWPRRRLWLAAVLALGGVYLLFRPVGTTWTTGDALTLLAAVAFADYVLELGERSREIPVRELVLAQTVLVGVLALIASTVFEEPRFEPSLAAFGTVVYLGLATVVTFTLMSWGQARLEPVEAAVLYTLEPVMAAVASVLAGREPYEARLVAGGAVILLGMLVAGSAGRARARLRHGPR